MDPTFNKWSPLWLSPPCTPRGAFKLGLYLFNLLEYKNFLPSFEVHFQKYFKQRTRHWSEYDKIIKSRKAFIALGAIQIIRDTFRALFRPLPPHVTFFSKWMFLRPKDFELLNEWERKCLLKPYLAFKQKFSWWAFQRVSRIIWMDP